MTGTAPPTAVTTCEVCGRPPARWIYASKYSGRVLFGDEIFWKGDACRQCAICQYRAGLAHCLWAGWWSPVGLVVNPRMIYRNAKGLRAAKAMPDPEGTPLAEPLDPGAPILRRPAAVAGALVPVALVGAVIALVVIVAGTGSGRLDDLGVGECIDLPSGTVIEQVDPVSCDGPHDAEVTGTISGAPKRSQDLCVAETTSYLGVDGPVDGLIPSAIRFSDGGTAVCLITSDGGRRLVGDHRGAGR